jgi:hypothetical protein
MATIFVPFVATLSSTPSTLKLCWSFKVNEANQKTKVESTTLKVQRVDGHLMPRLFNDMEAKIGQDGAKVLPECMDLAMVVHKYATQLEEAQKGKGPNVEATTFSPIYKGKGAIHVVGVPTPSGGTRRPTTNKHSFKSNLKKVKKLLEVAFKHPKGKVIQRPLHFR